MRVKTILQILVLVFTSIAMIACDKTERSFSILPEEDSFNQSVDYTPRKMDILWIVDNSGSMLSSQSALTTNFQSFINRFQSLNYDFRMAVQTTDAFRGKFTGNDSLRRVRDGAGSNHSGVFVMDKDTPNLSDVFLINASQGTSGSGDERAFSSFLDTLDYTGNTDFRRPDAFLAIIIVSDEDDFSATISSYIYNNYNSQYLLPVSHFKDFLDTYTGGPENYSVNTISILNGDTNCLNTLNAEVPGRRYGIRYEALADLTGGVKGSLCDNFGDTLELISDSIIELSSSFKLSREPIVESIQITVDGVTVPQDSVNGWSYEASTWTITFHGNAVPPAGAKVTIDYEPVGIKQ